MSLIRICNTCLANGKSVRAQFVATDADGLMWFECDNHKPDDNVAGTVRVTREPIDEFLGEPIDEFLVRHGMPIDALDDKEQAPPTERNLECFIEDNLE